MNESGKVGMKKEKRKKKEKKKKEGKGGLLKRKKEWTKEEANARKVLIGFFT